MSSDYSLLDSGNYRKLEKFGNYVISRPCAAALWDSLYPIEEQNTQTHASFMRNGEEGKWVFSEKLPFSWTITVDGVVLELKCTDFGHLGFFPEHSLFWPELRATIQSIPDCRVLNLFAYTGGSSIVAALSGATVVHVDSSKSVVRWAERNVLLNGIKEKRIFWIIEDVLKFLDKEIKRKKSYDVIILDPPTYGRGASGEIFKIHSDLSYLLEACKELLSVRAKLLLFSTHTPGHSPLSIANMFDRYFGKEFSKKGEISCGEIGIPGTPVLPSGTFGKWICI